MRYFEIPTRPGQPFTERVSLLGVTYTLRFKWNAVDSVWILDIFDEAGTTAIACGIPLVTGTDLLGQYSFLAVGSKAAMIVTSVAVGIPPDEIPTLDSLGRDSHLYYITQ